MQNNTDDMSNESSEAAEVAPSATSGISKNPIGQDKASDPTASLANVPTCGKGDAVEKPEAAGEGDNGKGNSTAQQHSAVEPGLGWPPKVGGDEIIKLPLDKLLPHPLNEKLFGVTSPNEIKNLAASLAETGQLSPLVVTADLEKVGYYAILSGHKRADAMRFLKRTEVDCQLIDVQDADERRLCLLEANLQHKPTTEQRIRIGEVYFELETKKAKGRQLAGAKAAKKSGEVVEEFTPPKTNPIKGSDDASGKARDLAAAKVGMSGVSFDKGRKVLRAVEKAQQEGKKESAVKLLALLNEKGIDPAYEHAKVLHLIEQATKGSGTGGKVKGPDVPKNGADASQKPAPASNGSKADEAVTLPAPAVAEDADIKATADTTPPNCTNATVDAVEADDTPLVVRIVAACTKLVEDLEELDPADLTNDQKWNLTRAFDDLTEWFGNHDQMLKVPGQL